MVRCSKRGLLSGRSPPQHPPPDLCGGLFSFGGGESPRKQLSAEASPPPRLPASAGRGIWVPRHNSCQRYPEAACPGRTGAGGSPAAPVMPPLCTGANGPSLPWQGKSRPCRRVSSKDAKTGPLGDPALGPAPGAAGEGGISRGPGFPLPGQQDIQVSVPSVEEGSRWVGSWSRLHPGKAAGIAPTAPHRAGEAARPELAVFAEPAGALPDHVPSPRVCSHLILRDSGGVGEQFGYGSWDSLGDPSARGGMQPTSLPMCGSTTTFRGCLVKPGGLARFCHPQPCCHPALPARGEGEMGVSSSAGLTQPPPRGGCTGGNLSHTVRGGGFSISRLQGDGRAVGRGGTGSITGMEWGRGPEPPSPGSTSFPAVPGALWLRLPGFHLDYTFQA